MCFHWITFFQKHKRNEMPATTAWNEHDIKRREQFSCSN